MMRRLTAAATLAAAVIPLLASCNQNVAVNEHPTVAPADPLWSQLIAAHSTGAISRHSPLRVSFTSDVVPANKVGGDASEYLEIEPAVGARVTFASRREIIALPQGPLAPDTTYKVRVRGRGLTGIDARLQPFEFLVQTLARNFSVTTQGLDVDASAPDRMLLRGTLVTADVEDGAQVAKLLRAELDGESLPITWTHHDEERQHEFTVAPIVRADHPRSLKLAWDGAPMKIANSDTRDIEVPGRGQFTVTQAQAVEDDGQRRVIVQFSDKLAARQDLKGLVRLSQGEFTTQIRDNALTLYVNQEVVGEVTLSVEKGIRSAAGESLQEAQTFPLTFTSIKPQ